jgi:hypothetical protein
VRWGGSLEIEVVGGIEDNTLTKDAAHNSLAIQDRQETAEE